MREKELRDLALFIAKPSTIQCLEIIESEPEFTLSQRDVFFRSKSAELSPGIITKDLLGAQIFGFIENKQSESDKREVTYKLNKKKFEQMKQVISLLNDILTGE
jgi:hypothetical protein